MNKQERETIKSILYDLNQSTRSYRTRDNQKAMVNGCIERLALLLRPE